jgi:glutamate-1-semialdehyde 2,1-aminomutase
LAAVIIEPVQRVIPPQPGFLEGLREITSHYQIPLIFDEVVTGFRMAYGGAQEYYGVKPDLATYGKIVGGGMPLAAVAGREEVMAVCDPFAVERGDLVTMVGTLSGNPIAVAAGLAALEVLKEPGTYERVRSTGRRLMEALDTLMREAEIPAQVCGMESCFESYFTETPIVTYRDTLTADGKMAARYNDALLKRGILKGATKFYVGLCHTDEDVGQTIKAFEGMIEELRG